MKYATSTVAQHTRVNDPGYAAIARATEERIAYTRQLGCAQWKWIENVRNFSIYTKHEAATSGGLSVLATGVVKGSVHEIATLLASTTQQEYDEKSAAYHGKAFKHGTYIADITTENDNDGAADDRDQAKERLSIRSATFSGQRWLRREETWRVLDATRYDKQGKVFEKYLTGLQLEVELEAGGLGKQPLGRANSFQNVICGWKVQAEEPNASVEEDGNVDNAHGRGACARVQFVAEVVPSSASTSRSTFGLAERAGKQQKASSNAVRKRVLNLARNCERLSVLVRRRRLGVQVLMDGRCPTALAHSRCLNCEKIQLLAKVCRMCGNAVCKDCSDTYERETRRPYTSGVRIDTVRVCDPCLKRVERANYSNLTDGSLAGPVVFPDHKRASGSMRTAGSDLKTLLQNALRTAPSPKQKDAVLSVIHCVLDHDKGQSSHRKLLTKSTLSATMLSSCSDQESSGTLDSESISALDSFTLESVGYADATLFCQQGRSYPMDPHNEAVFPVPENEDDRVRAINDLGVLNKGEWDELEIICDLAAKEIGAAAGLVSVMTKDQQRIVAASHPDFRSLHSAREDSFCQHTIMANRPLIVPHPEADFRISHIAQRPETPFRFYCGFPLTTADNTVVGTLCCVDEQTRELTEAQYNALLRLAETASKIIRLEAKKRRRTVTAP